MTDVAVTGMGGFVGKALTGTSRSGLRFHNLRLNELDAILGSKDSFPEVQHVIHLAARTFVPESWKNPTEFYEVNVMGTQKVLEFCRKFNCSLTYISSYVYGQPEYLPIDEKHNVVPNTPYNHSKFLGEQLCTFYYNYFNVSSTIIRPFNLFGPDQLNHFLIPHIIEQAMKGDFIEVQTLDPKRDYLYIDDFVDFLIKTVNCKGHEVFNLGSGESYSVREIIDVVLKCTDRKNIPVRSTEVRRVNELMDVRSDIRKAKSIYNWEPRESLESGILKIIQLHD